MKSNPFRIIWLVIGFISLGIGGVGVVLPVLPTTPFLLLASFCFAKGSTRFYRWFLKTSIYQKHLCGFVENRSMLLKTKIFILLPASAMLIIAFLMMNNMPGRIFIIGLMMCKYYYFIFKIETIPVSGKTIK